MRLKHSSCSFITQSCSACCCSIVDRKSIFFTRFGLWWATEVDDWGGFNVPASSRSILIISSASLSSSPVSSLPLVRTHPRLRCPVNVCSKNKLKMKFGSFQSSLTQRKGSYHCWYRFHPKLHTQIQEELFLKSWLQLPSAD